MNGIDKTKAPVMFDKISWRYDLANRLISFGIDGLWRRRMARELAGGEELDILDLATGTGDVIVTLMKRLSVKSIIGVDPSEGMLSVAQTKMGRKLPGKNVVLMTGDAQALAFSDSQFDTVTISFGIRNVPDHERGLREMHRVLKPGGKVLVLEFSMPPNRFIRLGYLFYLRHILPLIGGIVSGDKSAYAYLNKTIESFPYGEDFLDLMRNAGFKHTRAIPLTFGVATIYVGEK